MCTTIQMATFKKYFPVVQFSVLVFEKEFLHFRVVFS